MVRICRTLHTFSPLFNRLLCSVLFKEMSQTIGINLRLSYKRNPGHQLELIELYFRFMSASLLSMFYV